MFNSSPIVAHVEDIWFHRQIVLSMWKEISGFLVKTMFDSLTDERKIKRKEKESEILIHRVYHCVFPHSYLEVQN